MPDRTGSALPRGCLEAETLAAYIDGGLDARQRADVEEHLASCTACSELISEVLRVQEAIPDVRPETRVRPGRFGRRKVVWTMSGVLVVAAALTLVVRLLPASWTGRVDTELADLVEAVDDQRPVEARLAGGFRYGPFRSPVRSGGRSGSKDNWALLAAAGKIREAVEHDNSPANMHALGVASLLVGDWDEAVRALEDAVRRDGGDAQYASDLAAAYLARGTGADRAADLAEALELLDRIAPAPACVECRFNRALSLELMHLTQDAIVAWDDYLTIDPSSPWSAEARTRRDALIALRDRPVSEYSPVPDVPCLQELQRVQDAAEVSRLADLTSSCERQIGHHATAEQRAWLGLFAAASGYYTGRHADADQAIDAALAARDADGDEPGAPVRGRLHFARGALQASRGDFQGALASMNASAALLASVDDIQPLSTTYLGRADIYRSLGRPYEAWRDYVRALDTSWSFKPGARQHSLLTSLAIASLASGLPHLTIRVSTLAEKNALAFRHPAMRSESLLYRARAFTAIGDAARASADLRVAVAEAEKLTEPALRPRMFAELASARSEILASREPEAAIEAARAAIAHYSQLGIKFRQAALYLTIARASNAAGRRPQAIEALNAGIALIESEQARLEERRLRVSHTDRTWNLYRDAIEMAVDDGDAERALAILERQRSRMSRLDAPPAGRTVRLTAPDALALVYLQTPARLLRWVVSTTGTSFSATPMTAEKMTTLVTAFRSDVAEAWTRMPVEHAAGELSAALLGGLGAELARATHIVIVPDAAIGDVPFGALRAPGSQQPLAARSSTAMHPSLGHALRSRASVSTVRDASVVVVVPPAPQEEGMSQLSWAARESEAVARLYGRARVVDGAAATAAALEDALERADVVHFAGHAVADAVNPWRSRLLLAADRTNPSGGWSTAEIDGGRIHAVAVLAACSTAEGSYRRGVGVISLASEMLAAGAPAVVATLWDIPDKDAAAVFVRLHAELRRHARVSDAVRAVQAASDVSPTKWALVAFGN